VVDFVEIWNISARKAIIEAVNRIINSDKVCRSYIDLNFGVTFFVTQCISIISQSTISIAILHSILTLMAVSHKAKKYI